MPEGLFSADGKPIAADAAAPSSAPDTQPFYHAMAAPPGDEKAPPKRAKRESTDSPAPRTDKPRVTNTGKKTADTSKKTAKPAASHAERVQAVQGLVQLGAAGCLLVSQRVPNPVPLQADSAVLAGSSEALAEAVANTADQDERFAAMVDRLAVAGPYGALITGTFAIGMQVARNHGVNLPGTQDPADIVAAQEVSVPAAA